MNITNLKTGMLVRDGEKLLEVTDVREDSATAEVCLERLDAPVYKWRINYSAEGVWSFLKTPTDEQLEAIMAVREGKKYVGKMTSDLEKPLKRLITDRMIFNCLGVENESVLTCDDDGDILELRTGDEVSWLKYSYFRVHGYFVREVRGYFICLTKDGHRVALKPGDVTKECG